MTAAPDLTATTESEAPAGDRGFGIFLIVTGAISLWASLTLTQDKITLLQAEIAGETKQLGCDLSAWVSCSNVVASDQAETFGFPNTFIGVVAFSALITLGIVLLSGFSMPRWMWLGLEIGTIFGIGFVTWLQYQAIFEIGYLCPWCMVVWAMVIPLFVVTTARVTGSRFLRDWQGLIAALWIIAVCAVIWFEFGTRLWA